MRIVAQLVQNAFLKIDGKVYSSINFGLFLLVSFTHGDTPEIAQALAQKVLEMRIFPDENGKTNLSITDVGGEILSVSQFTLYGEFKGRRPSFTSVLPGRESSKLYDIFNEALRTTVQVAPGVFGAEMAITSTNVGPVTYLIEENER